MNEEWYWCRECESSGCECGGGFYWDENERVDIHCPCCASTDVEI